MDVLLAATTNRGKLIEIRAIFERYFPAPLRVIGPAELGEELDVAEDGDTYVENAQKKALAYCRRYAVMALADDSGLEVDALGGQPGLHSARFTGKPDATDADRRALLVERLRSFPPPWTARFRCVAALAAPGGALFTSTGICPGVITPTERGGGGFGYDPLFQLLDPACGGRTMAELSLAEKNQVSHRALAVRGIFTALERLLQSGC